MITKQKKTSGVPMAAVLLIGLGAILIVLGVLWLSEQESQDGALCDLIPNPYSAEDFTYEDGQMTCLRGQSLLGVDVSYYQETIRWQQVADSGVDFAMIRLGYRGVYDGLLHADPMWEENYVGARAAGLQVGVYFYSQATSEAEARQEAQYLLTVLDGRALDMPVVFDWEDYEQNGRTAHMDGETLNACAIAFCEAIRQAGYEPMIYFNADIAARLWDLQTMQARGYGFWMALYRDAFTWPYRADIWQYTGSGQIDGIDTPVDMNLYFCGE